MNRSEIYGPVVHTLSFAEAAKQKIICNYKVVISVVTSNMLTPLRACLGGSRASALRQGEGNNRVVQKPENHRGKLGGAFQHAMRHGTVIVSGDEVKTPQVANQIALAQAVAEHHLKKIFTFHRNAASARSFASEGSEGIGTHLPDFAALHVNGTMSTAARDGLMTEFKAARQAVMSNARCLTEGIDVPTVDMVAFLTPKRSKVDIVQAVGRAMRNAPGKTTGYILVPLYLDQGEREPSGSWSESESLESAVARAEFDEVWAVLQALQEQDEVLDDLIHQMQAERRLTKGLNDSWFGSHALTIGKGVVIDDRIPRPSMTQGRATRSKGFNDSRLRERVEVLGPTLTLDKLRRAIATRCLDRLARPWDEMVQLLVAYQKQHRHPRVPKSAPAPWTELGEWVDRIRTMKRNGDLSASRQAQLDKLGFCWRVEGETLDSIEGLFNEDGIRKHFNLSRMAKYRKQGLIKPVGFAMAGAGMSAFYHPRQIAELKKALGITLESTEGLLNEKQFAKASGLSRTAKYRKAGLIEPVGYALTSAGTSAFYEPRQIAELKKALGITLDSSEGLLNENDVRKSSGLTKIEMYRKRGLIKPVGYGLTSAGLSPFYHPGQITELKKALGITLDSTDGLLNETEFKHTSGLTMVAENRKRGIISPAGFAIAGPGISAFYHPRQVAELKKALGITLDSTEGLLNEPEFMQASGLTRIAQYRKKNLIKPVGYALTHAGVSAYYELGQIAELKKALGITLDSTEGLLNEQDFRKASGLTNLAEYRRQELIKPVGFAMGDGGMSAFYHPRQIAELKKALGITLDNTKGLLNANEVRKASGLTRIEEYRKQGLLKPVGYAITTGGVSPFYHPRQIAELKKALGVTIDNTEGLLNEAEFRTVSGLTSIAQYRKRGLITPVGRGLTKGGAAPVYYHPRQIAELKKALGITLDSTKGLLNESEFIRVSGLAMIPSYRQRGLIVPAGKGMSSSKISFFYHPRQIAELKEALGITLESTKGLLNEDEFKKASGRSHVHDYRKRGLIKPVGFAMAGPGLSAFYHPRQIVELNHRLAELRSR